jgi:hypothetical protein
VNWEFLVTKLGKLTFFGIGNCTVYWYQFYKGPKMLNTYEEGCLHMNEKFPTGMTAKTQTASQTCSFISF